MSGDGTLPASETSVVPAFPLMGLLALASAGFITILTEALPAGLLQTMSLSLDISESLVGQLVTVYAVGSLLAAIPLVASTRHLRRRPLLLIAIAGFAVANTTTALSSSYALILTARFVAGISAGLLWALLAGYATRMVPATQQNRAMAVAMMGSPLAMALGIPAGTLLGQQIGWRWAFGVMSFMSVGLFAWARGALPDFPGQAKAGPLQLRRILALPGVTQVLVTMLIFVLAHNLLYTYVAPVLALAGVASSVDRYLLLFGAASIAGIAMAGALGDRHMRTLVIAGVTGFLVAAIALACWPSSPVVQGGALTLWGLGFGGAPAILQTALARNAGNAADVAQSLLVTGWNLAVAGGGLIGGMILGHSGAQALSWVVVPLLLVSVAVAWSPKAWHPQPPA